MPIGRDPLINIPSLHLRPATADDGLGNLVANGTDAVVPATGSGTGRCTAGAFPEEFRRDPYTAIGGGQENLRRTWVAVIGATTVIEGDAIQLLSGENAGTYRAEIVFKIPGERIVLLLTMKEQS